MQADVLPEFVFPSQYHLDFPDTIDRAPVVSECLNAMGCEFSVRPAVHNEVRIVYGSGHAKGRFPQVRPPLARILGLFIVMLTDTLPE